MTVKLGWQRIGFGDRDYYRDIENGNRNLNRNLEHFAPLNRFIGLN